MTNKQTETAFSVEAFDVMRRYHTIRGEAQEFHYVARPPVALVIPILDDGRLVMIQVYRASINKEVLEFPAGRTDPGEDPPATATRELLEEVGFEARQLDPIGTFMTAPHFSNEVVHAFVGRGTISSGQHLTTREQINIVLLASEDVRTRILRGSAPDGKTMAAWLLYISRLEGSV